MLKRKNHKWTKYSGSLKMYFLTWTINHAGRMKNSGHNDYRYIVSKWEQNTGRVVGLGEMVWETTLARYRGDVLCLQRLTIWMNKKLLYSLAHIACTILNGVNCSSMQLTIHTLIYRIVSTQWNISMQDVGTTYIVNFSAPTQFLPLSGFSRCASKSTQ